MFTKFNINNLNEYTSKTELATLLNVSVRTIHNYHLVAIDISDFYNDYPCYEDDEAYTRVSLTRYQAWVIQSLIMLGQRMPKSKMFYKVGNVSFVNKGLQATLSKEQFERVINKSDNIQNNSVTTICKVA